MYYWKVSSQLEICFVDIETSLQTYIAQLPNSIEPLKLWIWMMNLLKCFLPRRISHPVETKVRKDNILPFWGKWIPSPGHNTTMLLSIHFTLEWLFNSIYSDYQLANNNSPDSPFYEFPSITAIGQSSAPASPRGYCYNSRDSTFQINTSTMQEVAILNLERPPLEMQHSASYIPLMLHGADSAAVQPEPGSPTSVYDTNME